MLRILYASSPCGSGKTYQIVARACDMAAEGLLVIIVQPTKELIAKTINEELLILPEPPPYHVFHGDSIPPGATVGSSLAEYLESPQDGGHIIFTTHQTLQFVRYWPNKKDLHLLIDEELQVIDHYTDRLPHTHGLITKHIEIIPYNSIYGKIQVADQIINSKARNKDDDAILVVIQDPLQTLTNEYWDSFVNLEQYGKLISGAGQTFAFHSVLNPNILTGFGSVFMASAVFEDTAIYRLWTEAEVKFVPDTDFTKKLRYNVHPNGELITFYYVSDDPWSKRLRRTQVGDRTIIDLYLAAAEKLFGDSEFIFQVNNDFSDNSFGTQDNRLPNKPHGLNSYSHIDDMVFASSINPFPDHIKFLKSRGLSNEEIRACIYFATCYQAIMRTSIRNPDNTNPKRILVPDIGAAEHLQGLFPGSRIEWLDAGIPQGSMRKKGGRPRKHESNAARRAQQRKNDNEKLLINMRKLVGKRALQDHCKNGEMPERVNTGAENPISIISAIGTAVFDGSVFSHDGARMAFSFISCVTPQAFVQTLFDIWSYNIIASKKDTHYLSPSLYDPALCTDHDRGTGNILYCRHLYLDFDVGDLKPEDLPNLFPNLKMVVTNSFSHTAEHPRYRVVIPTTTNMPREIYVILQAGITAKLEDAGYWAKKSKRIPKGMMKSGLDTAKQSPASIFLLPCQREGSRDNFFLYYDEEGREFLDPEVWIENTLIPIAPDSFEPEQYEPPPGQTIDDDRVNAALARWQSTASGYGNEAFFQLAVDLRQAGMGASNIRLTLQAQSHFGRSPKERKAAIPDILKDLKNKSRVKLKD